MLMPPIVINRRTRSSPGQALAIAASAAVSSCSTPSSAANQRSTVALSWVESGCSASHFRPGPMNSLPENGGIKLACSTAWMRFLVRVMPCTIVARRRRDCEATPSHRPAATLPEVASRMQPCQRRRIDPVRLGLRFRDHPNLQRVGDHHATHVGLQQLHCRVV